MKPVVPNALKVKPPFGGEVPKAITHLRRFPFLILVDVSRSTGFSPDPDIHHINEMLSQLMRVMRSPTPSSDLSAKTEQIDICICAYSDTQMEILPWSTVANLPDTLPTLEPLDGTAMGAAFNYAINKISERIEYLNSIAAKSAPSHIIHLTDGAITDCKPGDPLWTSIQARIDKVTGGSKAVLETTPKVKILNFISPKGCVDGFVEINGKPMSGQAIIAELCGPAAVLDMGKDIPNFEALVKLIEKTVVYISNNKPTEDALKAGKEAAKEAAKTKHKPD